MAATLLRTIELLQSAVTELKLNLPLSEVERIAIMVNKAMSSQARSFHTAEHIFNLIDENRPLQNLAALFHDIVYFTIDDGFIPEVEAILSDYVVVNDGRVILRPELDLNTGTAGIVLSIFGFKPGDTLSPFGGMNESLSALVFAHELHAYLDVKSLLETICYIEATIPFRPKNKDGLTPAECLEQRLISYKKANKLTLNTKRIEQIIQKAVTFANKDVENFAEMEVSAFLDNTWKLLPETNPSLRTTGLYTVKNYRLALQKMTAFMNMLDPGLIYSSFHGLPSEEDLKSLVHRARRNVLAARDYLGIKLLTTGILESIADISGGDVPIALLMGDIADEASIEKFESMLPSLDVQQGAAIASTVFTLLSEGRQSNSNFDLNRSPLAKFIYLHIGTANMVKYLDPLQEMIDGKLPASEFLKILPRDLITSVLKACAAMAFTRTKRIEEFLNNNW